MALTAARNIPALGQYHRLLPQPVAADTTLYVGALVALNAAGHLIPAQRTGADTLATVRVYGVCSGQHLGVPGQDAVNTGPAGTDGLAGNSHTTQRRC